MHKIVNKGDGVLTLSKNKKHPDRFLINMNPDKPIILKHGFSIGDSTLCMRAGLEVPVFYLERVEFIYDENIDRYVVLHND